MALGFPEPIDPDDARLQGHETTYQAARGGYFPPTPQQRAHEEVVVTVERVDE